MPAECDVSIRPGWFYPSNQDDKVKSPEQLFSIYLKSVGRGANLLLNVPPDRRGLIAKNDSAALMGFKDLRDRNFKTNLLVSSEFDVRFDQPGGGVFSNEKLNTLRIKNLIDNPVTFNFTNPIELNCIVVGENTQLGQNIRRFEILDDKKNSPLVTGTSIGQKRMILFPRIKTSSIVFRVSEATSNIELNDIQFYLIDEKFVQSNK
jgi:alpha-L-fucosidase